MGKYLILACAIGATTRGLAAAQSFEMNAGLAAHLQSVDFRIVAGRIEATSQQFGGHTTSTAKGEDRQETLSVNCTAARPSVQYQLLSYDVEVTLQIVDGNQLLIRRQPKSGSEAVAVEFSQQPGHPLVLTLGGGLEAQAYRAPTLWHLLLAYPETCERELLPWLDMLRPDWRLAETAAQIEDSLYRAARRQTVPDRARWTQLVAELAAVEFSRRQAADRMLRSAGQAVLPFLERLDPEQLDAEQRFRIRRMIASLTGSTSAERPQQIAVRMAGDCRVWVSLLSRPDAARRRLATEQLGRLFGEPIDFDPQADDATRSKQMERLRVRCEMPAGE